MCDTHEPPPPETEDGSNPVERNLAEQSSQTESDSSSPEAVEIAFDSSSPIDPASPTESPAVKFPDDITNENICVFISGYFEFYHETKVSIESVKKFMPGVRVTVASHPMDFHVFNR